MWSDVVSFVRQIITGSTGLFGMLASNSLLGSAYSWLLVGFTVWTVFRFVLKPLFGGSPISLSFDSSDDGIRKSESSDIVVR